VWIKMTSKEGKEEKVEQGNEGGGRRKDKRKQRWAMEEQKWGGEVVGGSNKLFMFLEDDAPVLCVLPISNAGNHLWPLDKDPKHIWLEHIATSLNEMSCSS